MFWAYPENYEHVADNPVKVVSMIFSGDEMEDYNKLIPLSGQNSVQAAVKKILHDYLK